MGAGMGSVEVWMKVIMAAMAAGSLPGSLNMRLVRWERVSWGWCGDGRLELLTVEAGSGSRRVKLIVLCWRKSV